MTPKWHWILQGQSYLIFVLLAPRVPYFTEFAQSHFFCRILCDIEDYKVYCTPYSTVPQIGSTTTRGSQSSIYFTKCEIITQNDLEHYKTCMCSAVESVLKDHPISLQIWSVKKSGLWWQIQLHRNVIPSAWNMWHLKPCLSGVVGM